MYDETETAIDHMATALLANTADRKKGVHLDSLYYKPSRHALGKIKSGENLLKLVGQLNKAKVSAFENQSFYLQAFLVRRGYSDDEIDEYLQQGPLIRIIEKTYQYYSQFLGKLRDLHYEHEKRWENGPAVVLLEYHSDKLFHIRRTSVNRKIHLLRTYTYLRDAAADNFNTSDLNEALWSRLTKISQEVNLGESNDGGKNNGGKPRPTGEGKTTCTLCGSRELHSLHKVGHNAGACPLAGQDADKIVRMRKKIMRVYKLDKSKDIKKVLQDTTSTWGDQQDS